jgi:hypothetical protein
MRRVVIAAVVAVGMLLPGLALAQVGATFVMRSGERVSGSLVDFSARGVEASVNGQSRTFSPGELAVIDFTNSATYPDRELDQAGSGNQVLALRNGSTLTGQLYDVGGKNPLRISFTSGGNTRDFSSSEVARIYFARPSGSSVGGGQTPGSDLQPGSGRITVPGNSDWVFSGLNVAQGQTLLFSANGEVRLSANADDVAIPAGSRKGRYAQNAPLPNVLAGALIGRIGNGPPFGIGNQTSIPAPGSGQLFLRVNDDQVSDNAGSFGVTVTATGNTVRRR